MSDVALDKKVLTLPEAAKYLQVHPVTLYRLLKTGRLPGAFKIGRVWRINREALEHLATGVKAGDERFNAAPAP